MGKLGESKASYGASAVGAGASKGAAADYLMQHGDPLVWEKRKSKRRNE
jgi:hypothetical protein